MTGLYRCAWKPLYDLKWIFRKWIFKKWILNSLFSGILDSKSWILDSNAKYSRFHGQNFPVLESGFPYMGRHNAHNTNFPLNEGPGALCCLSSHLRPDKLFSTYQGQYVSLLVSFFKSIFISIFYQNDLFAYFFSYLQN